MKVSIALLATLGCTLTVVCPVVAQVQEILANGDFEIIALDETEMPLLDPYGNQMPIEWFRAVGGEPPPGTPKTALITNDDSDGTGTNSIVLNPVFGFGDPHSDWRSQSVATIPGETLSFSFDFKFLDVPPDFIEFQQFRIELRSFLDAETTMFVGEQIIFVSPVAYEILGQGSVSENFNDQQWHTLGFDRVVPENGVFSDVRVSINAFTSFTEGQVRIDNVSITRPLLVTADYNDNGIVDAADYTVWRDTLGSTTDLRADGDGSQIVNQGDYEAWVAQFGTMLDPGTSAAATVPEPASCGLFLMLATVVLVRARLQSRKG